MASRQPAVTRRALLGTAALLPLAACRTGTATAPRAAPGTSSPAATTASPAATAASDHRARFARLERRFGARLGVYAHATGTDAVVAYRADERFAFCSTFKGLAAAAVLHGNPLSHLDTRVRYTEEDLMTSSVVTRRHVGTGMTIRQLCDAAVRHSDGTAGNLLLRDLGGPAKLTAYARGLGDEVTRMDRREPRIADAVPGDLRDTTTPRAIGTDYRKIVVEDALPADQRAFLRDLLERNATPTGKRRIRAGVPRGWTVADKTGTGGYGAANDIAVVWPPASPPLVIAVMSTKATRDAAHDDKLLAEAAAYVISVLT